MTATDLTFDDHFEALAALAYRVGFRLLGNRAEAEEVAQEALARAFARWPSVRRYAEPWVVRVATNLALGRLRRRRPTVTFEDHHSVVAPNADTHTLERLELGRALARLPRRQRQAVALRYLADLPVQDVAKAMKTTVGSVKQHTHRALTRLRVDLSPLPFAMEADDV